MRLQILIAFLIAIAVGVPVILIKYRNARKEGKSVKYLEFKIAIAIGLPIISVPFLLSNELSIMTKLLIVIAMFIGGVAYALSITAARQAFRKVMGLPPEDEHTGEVKKENKAE